MRKSKTSGVLISTGHTAPFSVHSICTINEKGLTTVFNNKKKHRGKNSSQEIQLLVSVITKMIFLLKDYSTLSLVTCVGSKLRLMGNKCDKNEDNNLKKITIG